MRICCEWPNSSDDIAVEYQMPFGPAFRIENFKIQIVHENMEFSFNLPECEVPLKYSTAYKMENTIRFAFAYA